MGDDDEREELNNKSLIDILVIDSKILSSDKRNQIQVDDVGTTKTILSFINLQLVQQPTSTRYTEW